VLNLGKGRYDAYACDFVSNDDRLCGLCSPSEENSASEGRVVVHHPGPTVAVVATDARYPTPDEIARVKKLAFQMEIDTDEAYIESVRAAQHDSEREQAALHNLYVLKESADTFYEQVGHYYAQPAKTTDAFNRLNNDFIKAREEFPYLTSYHEYRQLFETIIDTMGNLRFYYVASGAYRDFLDHAVYPYYPGYPAYVHIYLAATLYYYRHPSCWHLHSDHYLRFPHRANYRYGYGRYEVHFSANSHYTWHRAHYRDRRFKRPAPPPRRRRR
jgi:hypothetical protein